MFLVVTLLAVTMVATGAVVGPQLGKLSQAVNGEAAFEISLAALDTRSVLYDKDGNEIFRFVDDGTNRELMPLEDMPDELITSVVTIEDGRRCLWRAGSRRGLLRQRCGRLGLA